ncbi:DUF6542 domain-containing protein [Streptomyces sp. NPDC093970]|uniref:DUF6542 domain-containing protein n=1 Tax=Streptomyces sp. NPDC093970 TaxID=3155076 RepID=UPI00342241F9
MEHHRTRPRQHGQRRGAPRPPLPPQAGRRPAAERPPAPGGSRPAAGAGPRQPSGPRLTGLGGGLFCVTAMFLLGFLDDLLFGASLTGYGVLSLPVCALTALWVRGSDLLTAPVVVPIAFAAGLLTVADDGGGFLGGVMGLVTALSTQAGWLYGGTLVAGLITVVRRIRMIRRRRRG